MDNSTNQSAGASGPVPGDPVDLSTWAYVYRKGSSANPSETAFLFPSKFMKMEVINGSMTWQYLNSPGFVKREEVLAGLLWEEPRSIERVVVEFQCDHASGIEEVQAFGLEVASMWEDVQAWKDDPILIPFMVEGAPVRTDRGTMIVTYRGSGRPTPKIYIRSTRADLEVLNIASFGLTSWMTSVQAEIEWGFGKSANRNRCDGKVEVYNGSLVSVASLDVGSSALSIDGAHWSERADGQDRRGVKISVFSTDGKWKRDRTVVSLCTTLGNVSFAWDQLANGPIIIPSLGICVVAAGSTTVRDFMAQQVGQTPLTTRQSIRAGTEVSWASAMKRFHGQTEYPPFPEPALPPPMRIHVPEPELEAQWNLGAWHLMRWSQSLPDERLAVSIWPFTKLDGGREGAACIGCESFQILRTLDLLGCHEAAEQGLNYWIKGDHAIPFVRGAEVMGQDSLVNSFNSPNQWSPGYDQKHSGGHGRIMQTAVFHYRMTRNDSWLAMAGPVLERAAQATLRVRREGMRQMDPGAWCYGLIPPSNTSDLGCTRVFFYQSAVWYGGLLALAEILDTPAGGELKTEADHAVNDLRRAIDRAMELSPVVKVSDGSFRRWPPFVPHLRGIDLFSDNWSFQWHERMLGGMHFVDNRIYGPDELVVDGWLDVYEDRLVQDGQNGQNGYNHAILAHLLTDDIPLFLRGMYHAYAAEVDPGLGYIFWEGEKKGGAQDKTFEEAAFLERVRHMLVMEQGDSMWIARATPRVWLEQGKEISVENAPTYFGRLDYKIVSDTDNGKINATVSIPSRHPAKEIWLRLRHPKAAPIKSVTVNGKEWTEYNKDKEYIILKGLTGTVAVTAQY